MHLTANQYVAGESFCRSIASVQAHGGLEAVQSAKALYSRLSHAIDESGGNNDH
jgi:hypothetical protein